MPEDSSERSVGSGHRGEFGLHLGRLRLGRVEEHGEYGRREQAEAERDKEELREIHVLRHGICEHVAQPAPEEIPEERANAQDQEVEEPLCARAYILWEML